MFKKLKYVITRLLTPFSVIGLVACGQFPEPATEQPRLSEWVAEQYLTELQSAEIIKINSYSDQFEKPIYVELRENVPIYFPYPKGRHFVAFVVFMRDGKSVVKLDDFNEADFPQVTDAMAWVIGEAIRRAKTHNETRDAQNRGG